MPRIGPGDSVTALGQSFHGLGFRGLGFRVYYYSIGRGHNG